MPKPGKGFIYVFRDPQKRNGLIKIGFSTSATQERCFNRRYKTSHPIGYFILWKEIVCTVGRYEKEIERLVHNRYIRFQDHGEWYAYNGDLNDVVSDIFDQSTLLVCTTSLCMTKAKLRRWTTSL